MHAHHLGTLLNYRLEFGLEWGLTCSMSNRLPGGVDAAGPQAPLRRERLQSDILALKMHVIKKGGTNQGT